MALENLVQQSPAADGFHAALIGPPQHIDDGFAAVADDLNITSQHQLPSLTIEGEGERSAWINNSGAILFERCPDAYLTPFSVEGFGERHHDAGVFAPTFGTAVGALLGAVVVQQNDAAAEWLADDLAEVSEQFTARKIVFMAPASRASDALQAAGFQWEADELRRKADIAEMQRMNERIDESRLLQQQAAQKREEWQSMGLLERLGHQPLSPEVIAANRRKWGIKGR